ncbi:MULTISPECIES: cutinase family protein [unclassified Rhodococcus (in: high G+C Gram-positive bacteria)]|uniref:cutinase family protein n=1 Tax=unclassified Rhodococcus (in: high G+C Gram-positive bacteria) TaxID=192944 RepID=UPI0009FC10FA|nr:MULTISPECIES: cutinase family protein [unclassified Rhodococcus (in: high G+C Gram-positive bacteria)]
MSTAPTSFGRRRTRRTGSNCRALALGLAISTLGAGTLALTVPTLASATPSGCSDVLAVMTPGTWETTSDADPRVPVGMLAAVGNSLKTKYDNKVEIFYTPYAASAFDQGKTYGDSKTTAIDAINDKVSTVAANCPQTEFIFSGYSQGADATGDIASAVGNGKGPISADKVLAVGLLADPGRGTEGESVVGPSVAGTGIADPRPHGMGTLTGRVATICDPQDLYCSIDKGRNSILGALGTVLSKSPGASTDSPVVGGGSRLATALTSDFSHADLSGIGDDVADLTAALNPPERQSINVSSVAHSATSLLGTLSPLAELLTSAAANPASTSRLAAAPAGTSENAANQVLADAQASDLSGALSSVNRIASAATQLIDTGNTSLATRSPEAGTLAGTAAALNNQVAPLAATPPDVLGQASSVLAVLKPRVVVDQVLNIATGITSINYPAILNDLAMLPQRVAALDVAGAHQIAGDLNNQFAPLVKMAADVDLTWISQILSAIPDPTGTAQIAAVVCDLLSRVDITRIANNVGQIQEIAWQLLEGNPAALTGLLPIGLDLASAATTMITGNPTHTDTSLDKDSTPDVSPTQINHQTQNNDLNALTSSLTAMARTQDAEDLTALVGQGLNAATFVASGAHTNYTQLTVDNTGRNAIQWLTDWFALQIQYTT